MNSAHAQIVAPAAPCDAVIGTIVTCSGNLQPGVSAGGAFTVLNVNGVTQNIAPAAMVDGISFVSPGAVTINSSTGAFSIITQGNGGGGVIGSSTNSTVSITHSGNITTNGASDAEAVFAESLAAGAVTVTTIGNFSTVGDNSEGVFARSAGGADVSVVHTGVITTTGNDADGILAASTAAGGDVTVTLNGSISVTGPISDGIDAAAGTGDATVTVSAGSTISVGAGAGEGVDFNGGADNRLINFGTIASLGLNAVMGDTGNDVVDNSGTITGNVRLGGGTNAFNNMAAGLFNAGTVIDLGAVGNTLNNAGTLSPGATGTVQTSALTGTIVQTSSGIYATDVDLTSQNSDRVNVSGSATLEGNVRVSVLNPAVGSFQTIIMQATGGVNNIGLGLIASPALQAQLLFPNATDVVLGISVDFTPLGTDLNRNQTQIAEHLNGVLGAGGGNLNPVLNGLLNVGSTEAYKAALDQLSPEIYLQGELATQFFAEEFTNNLLSCPAAGSGFSVLSQGQCVWVRPEGRFLNRDRTREDIGFDETVAAFSAGAQVAIAPNWFAGFGLGYEAASLEGDAGAESDSDRYAIGGALKYQSGAFLLATAVSGGVADIETSRSMNFGGFNSVATSDHDITYAVGKMRAAYLFGSAGFYAKPFVDLNLVHIDRDGVTETGGGAANLNVAGGDDTLFSVTPSLELGAEYATAGGGVIRPFVRAGVVIFNDSERSLNARFTGSPAGVGDFTIITQSDDVMADIEAGATWVGSSGASVMLSYEGLVGDDVQQHGFVLKGTSKF